jgi:hypothetical protein
MDLNLGYYTSQNIGSLYARWLLVAIASNLIQNPHFQELHRLSSVDVKATVALTTSLFRNDS